MSLDVVMPTWNSFSMLKRSLGPIIDHLRPDNIIVVDRVSADGTLEIAREHGAVCLTDTTSLGSARMRGVRHSTADWIAFIDDDIIIPPNFREDITRHLASGIGAIQAGAVSVHQPYRMIHQEEFGRRMGERDHFDLLPGERGFTNATLIRRDLLADLDLTAVDTWEDWVIAQRVLSSGYRWLVVRPFVEHIHEFSDLAKKEGWNAAGILNLARTGHMPLAMALGQYYGKIMLALKGSIKYTIIMRSPSTFFEYQRFIFNILSSPRFLYKPVPRLPRTAVPSDPIAVPAQGKNDG